MEANKREFIEKKLSGMDHQYFTYVSMHLTHMGKSYEELLKELKEALSNYFVSSFEIAEAKYIGYAKLVEDAATEEDENAIESEVKETIKALEQRRRQNVGQINGLHEKLLELIKQPFPLDSYDAVHFNEGKMYPCEDNELRSAS